MPVRLAINLPISPSRWLGVIAATLLIPLAIGCASPGPPRPPSLNLPQVVNDLTAERIGDEVVLRWTTPARTTDDIDIKGPVTAEACRQVRVASPPQQIARVRSDCVPVKRIAVHPGPTEVADELPSALTGDPAGLLLYRVRLFNAVGRTAGPSTAADSVSGAAPPPVDQLRATSTRSGVVLEWKQEPGAFVVDLNRKLIAPSGSPKSPKPPAASKSAKPRVSSLNPMPATPAEIRLQAGEQSPVPNGNPDGTIDRTVEKGATYSYSAQRVRTANVAGYTLNLRSLPSATVTVVTRDIFPPAAPAGLAAVPGSTGPAAHSIDLSWEPVPDTDVAGYIVYRQQAATDGTPAGPSQRLTPTPAIGPAFSDQTAAPGKSYIYRVTAIDIAGNESAPSAPVQETVPEPQP